MAAPYDQPYAHHGQQYFDAPIPAWANIGQRFDELSKAYYDYEYGSEYFAPQRELLAAMQAHLPAMQARPATWKTANQDLEKRFAERYAAVKSRINRAVVEYFETGQMPAGEYLEWLILETRSRLAGQGDPETDWDALEAERGRLTERLAEGGYVTQRDVEMQSEDPARYTFLQKSLSLLNQQMQNPGDQASFEAMLAQQMKLLEESPFYAQAQQQMGAMLQGLESLKDSVPELPEQQRGQMEDIAQLFRDPAGAMHLFAGADSDNEEGDEDEEDEALPELPAGTLRFACLQKKVTAARRKLFHSLQKDAPALLPQIERALRQMHGWMNQGPADDPREAVLFPAEPDTSDVPLQAFSIERVELDSQGRWAILWLDTLFPHFDEHACGIRIEGGQVTRYGTWDEVSGDEEDETSESGREDH